MVRIAQASKGETGYTNQQAGNQTGRELNITNWYSRPWDTVLRAKDPAVAERIATAMEQAVHNLVIGYDQAQRVSLFAEASKMDFDLSKIVVPCECDCSSLVAVAVNAAGIEVSKNIWTGSMTSALMRTGEFDCLRDPQYLKDDTYLRRGDILLNTIHHAAVCLDNGPGTGTKIVSYAAQVNVQSGSYLNVRTGPGTSFPVVQVGGSDFRLPRGLIVAICEECNGWGRLLDLQGWVSLSYVSHS